MMCRAGTAPPRPRLDGGAPAKAKRRIRRPDPGPAGAGELAGGDDEPIARLGRVELGEPDQSRRAGGSGKAGAGAAARIRVVPEVADQPRPLAGELEIELARARDDELAGLVVERLEL